jgi:DedD protein
MAPPRRARPQPRSARLASFLFLVGCLVVLGVTFVLGVAAGRHWPTGVPGLPWTHAVSTAAPARTERERRPEAKDTRSEGRPEAREARGAVKPLTEAPPLLTFYHELTAPLASPPPATARPASKPPAKPAETPKSAEAPKLAPRPAETPKPVAAERADGRFTVQVGAFKSRGPAEALRARLAAGGQDVSVSEIDAGGATQYRVRVGTFATREAAQQAAARLAGERQIATYVTTR